MGKRSAGHAQAGPQVKVSVVMSAELREKVEQARRLHGLSFSTLVRKLIAGGIDSWLATQGTPAGALQQQGVLHDLPHPRRSQVGDRDEVVGEAPQRRDGRHG